MNRQLKTSTFVSPLDKNCVKINKKRKPVKQHIIKTIEDGNVDSFEAAVDVAGQMNLSNIAPLNIQLAKQIRDKYSIPKGNAHIESRKLVNKLYELCMSKVYRNLSIEQIKGLLHINQSPRIEMGTALRAGTNLENVKFMFCVFDHKDKERIQKYFATETNINDELLMTFDEIYTEIQNKISTGFDKEAKERKNKMREEWLKAFYSEDFAEAKYFVENDWDTSKNLVTKNGKFCFVKDFRKVPIEFKRCVKDYTLVTLDVISNTHFREFAKLMHELNLPKSINYMLYPEEAQTLTVEQLKKSSPKTSKHMKQNGILFGPVRESKNRETGEDDITGTIVYDTSEGVQQSNSIYTFSLVDVKSWNKNHTTEVNGVHYRLVKDVAEIGLFKCYEICQVNQSGSFNVPSCNNNFVDGKVKIPDVFELDLQTKKNHTDKLSNKIQIGLLEYNKRKENEETAAVCYISEDLFQKIFKEVEQKIGVGADVYAMKKSLNGIYNSKAFDLQVGQNMLVRGERYTLHDQECILYFAMVVLDLRDAQNKFSVDLRKKYEFMYAYKELSQESKGTIKMEKIICDKIMLNLNYLRPLSSKLDDVLCRATEFKVGKEASLPNEDSTFFTSSSKAFTSSRFGRMPTLKKATKGDKLHRTEMLERRFGKYFWQDGRKGSKKFAKNNISDASQFNFENFYFGLKMFAARIYGKNFKNLNGPCDADASVYINCLYNMIVQDYSKQFEERNILSGMFNKEKISKAALQYKLSPDEIQECNYNSLVSLIEFYEGIGLYERSEIVRKITKTGKKNKISIFFPHMDDAKELDEHGDLCLAVIMATVIDPKFQKFSRQALDFLIKGRKEEHFEILSKVIDNGEFIEKQKNIIEERPIGFSLIYEDLNVYKVIRTSEDGIDDNRCRIKTLEKLTGSESDTIKFNENTVPTDTDEYLTLLKTLVPNLLIIQKPRGHVFENMMVQHESNEFTARKVVIQNEDHIEAVELEIIPEDVLKRIFENQSVEYVLQEDKTKISNYLTTIDLKEFEWANQNETELQIHLPAMFYLGIIGDYGFNIGDQDHKRIIQHKNMVNEYCSNVSTNFKFISHEGKNFFQKQALKFVEKSNSYQIADGMINYAQSYLNPVTFEVDFRRLPINTTIQKRRLLSFVFSKLTTPKYKGVLIAEMRNLVKRLVMNGVGLDGFSKFNEFDIVLFDSMKYASRIPYRRHGEVAEWLFMRAFERRRMRGQGAHLFEGLNSALFDVVDYLTVQVNNLIMKRLDSESKLDDDGEFLRFKTRSYYRQSNYNYEKYIDEQLKIFLPVTNKISLRSRIWVNKWEHNNPLGFEENFMDCYLKCCETNFSLKSDYDNSNKNEVIDFHNILKDSVNERKYKKFMKTSNLAYLGAYTTEYASLADYTSMRCLVNRVSYADCKENPLISFVLRMNWLEDETSIRCDSIKINPSSCELADNFNQIDFSLVNNKWKRGRKNSLDTKIVYNPCCHHEECCDRVTFDASKIYDHNHIYQLVGAIADKFSVEDATFSYNGRTVFLRYLINPIIYNEWRADYLNYDFQNGYDIDLPVSVNGDIEESPVLENEINSEFSENAVSSIAIADNSVAAQCEVPTLADRRKDAVTTLDPEFLNDLANKAETPFVNLMREKLNVVPVIKNKDQEKKKVVSLNAGKAPFVNNNKELVEKESCEVEEKVFEEFSDSNLFTKKRTPNIERDGHFHVTDEGLKDSGYHLRGRDGHVSHDLNCKVHSLQGPAGGGKSHMAVEKCVGFSRDYNCYALCQSKKGVEELADKFRKRNCHDMAKRIFNYNWDNQLLGLIKKDYEKDPTKQSMLFIDECYASPFTKIIELAQFMPSLNTIYSMSDPEQMVYNEKNPEFTPMDHYLFDNRNSCSATISNESSTMTKMAMIYAKDTGSIAQNVKSLNTEAPKQFYVINASYEQLDYGINNANFSLNDFLVLQADNPNRATTPYSMLGCSRIDDMSKSSKNKFGKMNAMGGSTQSCMGSIGCRADVVLIVSVLPEQRCHYVALSRSKKLNFITETAYQSCLNNLSDAAKLEMDKLRVSISIEGMFDMMREMGERKSRSIMKSRKIFNSCIIKKQKTELEQKSFYKIKKPIMGNRKGGLSTDEKYLIKRQKNKNTELMKEIRIAKLEKTDKITQVAQNVAVADIEVCATAERHGDKADDVRLIVNNATFEMGVNCPTVEECVMKNTNFIAKNNLGKDLQMKDIQETSAANVNLIQAQKLKKKNVFNHRNDALSYEVLKKWIKPNKGDVFVDRGKEIHNSLDGKVCLNENGLGMQQPSTNAYFNAYAMSERTKWIAPRTNVTKNQIRRDRVEFERIYFSKKKMKQLNAELCIEKAIQKSIEKMIEKHPKYDYDQVQIELGAELLGKSVAKKQIKVIKTGEGIMKGKAGQPTIPEPLFSQVRSMAIATSCCLIINSILKEKFNGSFYTDDEMTLRKTVFETNRNAKTSGVDINDCWVLEEDITMMDGKCNDYLIKMVGEILTRTGAPKGFDEFFFEIQTNNVVKCPDYITKTHDNNTAGHAFTLLKNILCTMVCLMKRCDMGASLGGCFKGDDSYVVFKEKIKIEQHPWIPYDFKTSFNQIDGEYVFEFCRNLTNGKDKFSKDIVYRVNKMSSQLWPEDPRQFAEAVNNYQASMRDLHYNMMKQVGFNDALNLNYQKYHVQENSYSKDVIVCYAHYLIAIIKTKSIVIMKNMNVASWAPFLKLVDEGRIPLIGGSRRHKPVISDGVYYKSQWKKMQNLRFGLQKLQYH